MIIRFARISRECSLLGRREVLTGKAKFGIFGGGKKFLNWQWQKLFKKETSDLGTIEIRPS